MAVHSFEDLGPNAGLAEELYQQYRENPQSVDERWRSFFAQHESTAREDAPTPPPAPAAPPVATPPTPQPVAAQPSTVEAPAPTPPAPNGETLSLIHI